MAGTRLKWQGCIVTDEPERAAALSGFGAPEVRYRTVSVQALVSGGMSDPIPSVVLIADALPPEIDCEIVRKMNPGSVVVQVVSERGAVPPVMADAQYPDAVVYYPVDDKILSWTWGTVRRLLVRQRVEDDTRVLLQKAKTALSAYRRRNGRSDATTLKEREMLQHSLKQITLMTEERDRLEEKLAGVLKKQLADTDRLVDLLPDFLESRWPTHRGHSRKTQEIAVSLSHHLGMSEAMQRVIGNAARLHDIGLLGVTDPLLSDADLEDRAKQQFLAGAPERAARFLEGFSQFREEAQLIRYMREHVDGTGLPKGLKGKRIPLGSRILAVSEFFDERVNRNEQMSGPEALALMESLTGTRFDPRVIHALHQYLNRHPAHPDDRTLELKLYELKPGMRLATGIFAESGAKLVAGDTVLTEAAIAHLAKYNQDSPLEEMVFIRVEHGLQEAMQPHDGGM